MIANFKSCNDSSVEFFAYTFTRTTQWGRYHEMNQDMLVKMAEIIERHGAEIRFPTRTLHMPESARLAQTTVGAGLSPVAGPPGR